MATSSSPAPDDREVQRWTRVGEEVHAGYTRDFARFAPGTSVEEAPEAVYFRTGFPASTYNGAIVLGIPKDILAVVRTARAMCGRRVPWALSLRSDAWEAHRSTLEAGGFHLAEGETQPAMVLLGLERAVPTSPPGLRIVPVETPEQMGCFLATGARGFGFPGGALRRYLGPQALHAQVAALRTHWFVGLVDGEPVATSMSVVYGEAVYIAWVSTVPEHRKKGYGEALTWQAALAGRPHGAKVAILRASKMGEPVYRRMGFRTMARYHSVVAPDRAPLRGLRTLFWFLGVSVWYGFVRGRLRRWPAGESPRPR